MAPSVRNTRSAEAEPVDVSNTADVSAANGGMFERRRRRFQKNKVDDNLSGEQPPDTGVPKLGSEERKEKRRQLRKQKKEREESEVADPYDSDPGESYREHCKRNSGFSTKTCLNVPKFLRNRVEEESVLTAPPSPMASEVGENPFGQVPASLPREVTRVRYSLRSSITDGSEKQPVGPSVMERRELRPNNVRMNVSHWSDEGGRPYMEDRYVRYAFYLPRL
jgi:hypothetical protein